MHKKHTGPEPWEQDLEALWDKLTSARTRSGLREANTLAKRAWHAAQGDDTMSSNTSKAIALLQTERSAAEQAGDIAASSYYTDAIRLILVATGQAEDAGDPTSVDISTAPDNALAVDKMQRDQQDAFTKAYKATYGADIRARPGALSDNFAQSPPRATPAAPMAPAPDTQKLAKVKVDLEQAKVHNQIRDIYRRGPIK